MNYEEAYHDLLNRHYVLREENDRLKGNCSYLLRENEKLKDEMEMREREINDLTARCLSCKDECISLSWELSELKSKYDL